MEFNTLLDIQDAKARQTSTPTYNDVYEAELAKIDENNFAREAIARHYAKRWLELHVQLDELKKAFRNE